MAQHPLLWMRHNRGSLRILAHQWRPLFGRILDRFIVCTTITLKMNLIHKKMRNGAVLGGTAPSAVDEAQQRILARQWRPLFASLLFTTQTSISCDHCTAFSIPVTKKKEYLNILWVVILVSFYLEYGMGHQSW